MSRGIKIEVGEYKTRAGRDVVVVAVVGDVAIGYYSERGPETVSSWRADNGRYYIQTQHESCGDLVRKKPQRIKREVWLTVRSDHGDGILVGGGYKSLELAKQARGPSCTAIVRHEIDCMEGENLE